MSFKRKLFKWRDLVRFKWAQARYDFTPAGSLKDLNLHRMQHIVVLKIDGKLGDTQVMTHFYSVLNRIKAQTGLKLSVVCPPSLSEIYRDALAFDQVLTTSRKPKQDEINSLCEQLLSLGPVDLVLTTEPNFRPRDFIFNHYLKPSFVVGCETRVRCVNYLLYDPYQKSDMVAKCLSHFLAQAKVEKEVIGEISYQAMFTEQCQEEMRQYLSDAKAAKNCTSARLIGINPKASSKNRSFSPLMVGKIGAMVEAAIKENDSIALVLLSPQGEFQEQALRDLRQHTNLPVLTLKPQASAMEYAALISLLDALITVDTAAVHIACAAEIPFSAFYLGDLPISENIESSRWAPLYMDSNFVATMPSMSDFDVDLGLVEQGVNHLVSTLS